MFKSMACLRAIRRPAPQGAGRNEFAFSYCCCGVLAGGAAFGAAGFGVAGLVSGEVEPDPVVLGGVTLRTGPLLPVVIGAGGLVMAALSVELLFQPATTTKAIKATTARPATQPQMPPTLSSRNGAGWMKSVLRGSVER
jgi:hypothetical protein